MSSFWCFTLKYLFIVCSHSKESHRLEFFDIWVPSSRENLSLSLLYSWVCPPGATLNCWLRFFFFGHTGSWIPHLWELGSCLESLRRLSHFVKSQRPYLFSVICRLDWFLFHIEGEVLCGSRLHMVVSFWPSTLLQCWPLAPAQLMESCFLVSVSKEFS